MREFEPQRGNPLIVRNEVRDVLGHPLVAEGNGIARVGAFKQACTEFHLRPACRIDPVAPDSIDEFDLLEQTKMAFGERNHDPGRKHIALFRTPSEGRHSVLGNVRHDDHRCFSASTWTGFVLCFEPKRNPDADRETSVGAIGPRS
jgi:hypothetical protein